MNKQTAEFLKEELDFIFDKLTDSKYKVLVEDNSYQSSTDDFEVSISSPDSHYTVFQIDSSDKFGISYWSYDSGRWGGPPDAWEPPSWDSNELPIETKKSSEIVKSILSLDIDKVIQYYYEIKHFDELGKELNNKEKN